ncbi:ATP-binding protein [Patescibacteria group bacterium]|nr:ATP-binding protein [Patescibacteria group bacterium]
MNIFGKKQTEAPITGEIPSAEPSLVDAIAPAALQITSNYVQIGKKFARTFFVITYPRFLTVNWLSPIVNLDNVFNISMFIHPAETGIILKRLRKKLTQIESQIGTESEQGKIRDPILETASNDIEDLRDKLIQGTEKFFKYALYITIFEDSLDKLNETEEQILSLFEAKMVYIRPALFQQENGINSTLPLGDDRLLITNSMNTAPLSTIFPFVSSNLSSDKGILYGINRHNNSLIIFDRFSLENGNMVIFGKSGSGKSIKGDSPVLIRKNGKVELVKIGSLVENLIKEKGLEKIDKDLEGVINPNIEVFSFDQKLKGEWSKVTVAARKQAPEQLYKFKTRSGREITTTEDHNMLILKNGKVEVTKSNEIEKENYIPLPRKITNSSNPKEFLDLYSLLKDNKRIYIKNACNIIKENYKYLKKTKIDSRLDKYLCEYKKQRKIPIIYFNKILKTLNIDYKDYKNEIKITAKNSKISLPVLWKITPELVRILGYITSKGTITDNAIYITNNDSDLLNDVKNCFNKIKIPCFFGNKGIITACRTFIEINKTLDQGKYSSNKKVPSFLFQTNTEIISNFLKAYFEGDGGIEKNTEITVTSKSKQLISEISYLLYFFGIVSRISKTKKQPTNCNWKRKKTYYKIRISGQENIRKFHKYINFTSQRKIKTLSQIIDKKYNTNVDIIPEIKNIFKEIYQIFGSQLHGITAISPIKKGAFNPSPQYLNKTIKEIEQRIEYFKNLSSTFEILSKIPSLTSIIDVGKNNKELNRMLWQELGHSWRLMKNKKVNPGSINVFKAEKIINGNSYSLQEIKATIYQGFKEMSIPVKHYNCSLQTALVAEPKSNTQYETIQKTCAFIWQNYQKTLNKIPEIENKLNQLKLLANSDLFWDPIVEIKKLKNKKEKYVYDLTVNNEIFLAGNGGMFVHNSYAVKIEILRSLMFGTDVIVIDPENEFQYLAEVTDGAYFKISLASKYHINPFDISPPGPDETTEDVLRSKIMDLVGLLRVALGELTPEENSVLDKALNEVYAVKDITPQSDLKNVTPPLLEDLGIILENMDGGDSIAKRLQRYTQGSFSGFLNKPTNIDVNKSLVVFSIRDMDEELRPVAMYLILQYIWNLIRSQLKKRIMVVDEAWVLMRHKAGAEFLHGIAKRCRKYWLGLTTITQDIPDFMDSPYGKPIITNSSIQLLFKQSTATIDVVQKTFNLTDEEKYLLLQADVGEGIFFAGLKHAAIKVVASYTEDQIVTSSPEQIIQIEKAKKELKQE